VDYSEFLGKKTISEGAIGFDIESDEVNPMLFDWQKELVRLSLKRGRCALFEDCGLGKTFQQIEWARIINRETDSPVLILAPLAVSKQTRREGKKLGVDVNICRQHEDVKIGRASCRERV